MKEWIGNPCKFKFMPEINQPRSKGRCENIYIIHRGDVKIYTLGRCEDIYTGEIPNGPAGERLMTRRHHYTWMLANNQSLLKKTSIFDFFFAKFYRFLSL